MLHVKAAQCAVILHILTQTWKNEFIKLIHIKMPMGGGESKDCKEYIQPQVENPHA
jgi:hypothetical protein